MGVFLDQLADGLVAVVLQGWVVSQDLVGDVLGDLLVHACLRFFVSCGQLVPLDFLLLPLQLLHALGCPLAGN